MGQSGKPCWQVIVKPKSFFSSLQSAPFCNADGSIIKPGFAISFFTFLLYLRDYVSITLLTFIGLVHLQGDIVKDI
jgi:hypothetical protein